MSSPATYHSRYYTILVHLLIWAAFFLFPLFFLDTGSDRLRYTSTWWIIIVLAAAYFYLNYNLLIPRLLLRKRLILYIASLLLALTVVLFLSAGYFHLYDYVSPGTYHSHHLIPLRATLSIFPCVVSFALSSTIRITSEWFANEKRKNELETEKLTAELAFLKSQVNPHFLFNILNNICSLARKKSDDTEGAIIKLSQLMRYMLDDSKEKKVSLARELEYLNDYIELQQLRLSDKASIVLNVEGNPEHCQIEPMLLIPFVENAFKHGVSYLEHSVIEILLEIREGILELRVFNKSFRSPGNELITGEGIGLKNVRRRLELLYPGRYELGIREESGAYEVNLSIRLS
jgi:two-component system LytT family sensor kinase